LGTAPMLLESATASLRHNAMIHKPLTNVVPVV
jgi:hypothetical protein